MATHQALVLESLGQPLVKRTLPIPTAEAGSVVVKVLATIVTPNIKGVLSGHYPRPLQTPVTPSSSCIGRVHSVGPDATTLRPGDLVMTDLWVQARDDPDTYMLMGYMNLKGHQGLERAWPDGSYAEYARVPLERCWSINEEATQKLGYQPKDLAYLPVVAIPMSGLMNAGVGPGDTVVVIPATGLFGGSAVVAALGLGARVIACGRNRDVLDEMEKIYGDRVIGVKMTGEAEKDIEAIKQACHGKGADCFVDFTPPHAKGVNYLATGIEALRPGGTALIMGLVMGHVGIPYAKVQGDNIRIQGNLMFNGHVARTLIKQAEQGLVAIQHKAERARCYGLDAVEEAIESSVSDSGWKNTVILEPVKE